MGFCNYGIMAMHHYGNECAIFGEKALLNAAVAVKMYNCISYAIFKPSAAKQHLGQ